MNLINNERKPHLRLAITPECNFSCAYCKDGGEGILTDDMLNFDEIMTLLDIASRVGFKHIKITGGEPLVREKRMGDVIKLIQEISSKELFDDIQLVTNGSLLSEYAERLAKCGLNSITVSLDTTDAIKFKKITGSDSFNSVISGISKVREQGLPVTINAVIYKGNVESIPNLIKIAQNYSTRLKLIDYMDIGSKEGSCNCDYVSFNDIKKYLKNICKEEKLILPPGGLGTPMPTYVMEGDVNVLVKDSTVGTNYNSDCKECKNFPCQDALISLRITANGALKKCLMRDDNLVETFNDLKSGNLKDIERKLRESYDSLEKSEYIERAWKPLNKM